MDGSNGEKVQFDRVQLHTLPGGLERTRGIKPPRSRYDMSFDDPACCCAQRENKPGSKE
jgi:hypothetical protein